MEAFRYSIFASQKSSLRRHTKENKFSLVFLLAISTGFPSLFFQFFSRNMRTKGFIFPLRDLVVQLKYGLYQKIQDDFGGDGGAGVLQGRESCGENRTGRKRLFRGGAFSTSQKSAGNYRRRKGNADVQPGSV